MLTKRINLIIGMFITAFCMSGCRDPETAIGRTEQITPVKNAKNYIGNKVESAGSEERDNDSSIDDDEEDIQQDEEFV